MRLRKLELKNFKRFTHLTIDGIPETARLVLLIGSNGSGKSSVFDAFEVVNSIKKEGWNHIFTTTEYYRKDTNLDFEIKFSFGEAGAWEEATVLGVGQKNKDLGDLNFYGRSSFRQLPRLTRTSMGAKFDIEKDSDRPRYLIDRDERFENDIERITGIILRDLFRSADAQTKTQERFIDPINRALTHIFGAQNGTKLELIEIIPPLEGKIAQVNFRKGASEFHYNQLSAGEKEVINILVNLTSRRPSLENAICFFDEIDLHLNTRLQYRLLQEIAENWIPESSQLWTASHSLGFIDYARNSPTAAIIDFDDLDFDQAQNLVPVPKENAEVYEIAVGKEFLPNILGDKKLCFVENTDRDLYATLDLPKILFAQANNRNAIIGKIVADPSLMGLVDRDFLSDEDVEEITATYPNLKILPYYSIENLLFHPKNLADYYAQNRKPFDAAAYQTALLARKHDILPNLLPSIALKRTEYQYFNEPKFNGSAKQKRFRNQQENFDQSAKIGQMLQSNDFETWYKVFPMKNYATDVPQRQNIAKSDLIKTQWVKQLMGAFLKKN